jgi:hypothetical protein
MGEQKIVQSVALNAFSLEEAMGEGVAYRRSSLSA